MGSDASSFDEGGAENAVLEYLRRPDYRPVPQRELLHQSEVDHDVVLLDGTTGGANWTDRILRQADQVVVACSAEPGAAEAAEIDSLTAAVEGLVPVWLAAAHRSADLRTRYWDWTYRVEDGPYYLRFCGTPPVSHLFGLHEALRMIAEEGMEVRWERHRVIAEAVRAAVETWSTPEGLSLHATDPSERSNAVTMITTGSIDPDALSSICRERMGVTLGLGIGDFGPSFRIGHMGHVNAPMILGVLGSIEAGLTAIGASVGGSGVAAASSVLGDALR